MDYLGKLSESYCLLSPFPTCPWLKGDGRHWPCGNLRTRNRPDLLHHIHEASLNKPLLVSAWGRKVSTKLACCSHEKSGPSLEAGPRTRAISAEYLKSRVLDLDPPAWVEVVKRLPEDCEVAVETGDH